MPLHDDGYPIEGKREDVFAELAKRLPDPVYLELRNHFDTHLEDGNVEGAYLCLIKRLFVVMDNNNAMTGRLIQVFFGPDVFDKED